MNIKNISTIFSQIYFINKTEVKINIKTNTVRWDEHEKIVGEVAKEIGFDNVVLSSLSISMPKMLHRGSTGNMGGK